MALFVQEDLLPGRYGYYLNQTNEDCFHTSLIHKYLHQDEFQRIGVFVVKNILSLKFKGSGISLNLRIYQVRMNLYDFETKGRCDGFESYEINRNKTILVWNQSKQEAGKYRTSLPDTGTMNDLTKFVSRQ